MKRKYMTAGLFIAIGLLFLCACSSKRELVDMSVSWDSGQYELTWEGRTYMLFCVVSKRDCGVQIGYVNGDKDDRISEYKGYSPEEWLVSWIPTDSGAMLLKEVSVTEIPDGLEAEYQ